MTEISLNSRNDLYRAETEFIGQAEWYKELAILYQEPLGSHGNVAREAVMNEDSGTGLACEKFRAVYPILTKETMAQATSERPIEHKNAKVFGTIKILESDTASDFHQSLQRHVDSKEKVQKTGERPGENKAAREIEYWPLIKVIRLYVKASALETGAVIVDLPGVHGSNQARAAVAQRYMRGRTGLWNVAPNLMSTHRGQRTLG